MLIRRFLQLALGAMLLGCSVDLTPPAAPDPLRPAPVISVSATQLSWTRDSAVRYTVSNPDGVPVFTSCPFMGIEYYRDGWKVEYFQDGCLQGGQQFFPVAAGDSIVNSVQLTSSYFPRSGWYRFTLLLYRAESWSAPWGSPRLGSAPFYVGP